MTILKLKRIPTPKTVDALTPVTRRQLDVILQNHPRDWHELTDLFFVHDGTGAHVYDMHLFCDDDGQVFRAGTTENVATFSQGGPTSSDAALQAALKAALTLYRDVAAARSTGAATPSAKRKAKARASKKS